jgi:hypothetical protein
MKWLSTSTRHVVIEVSSQDVQLHKVSDSACPQTESLERREFVGYTTTANCGLPLLYTHKVVVTRPQTALRTLTSESAPGTASRYLSSGGCQRRENDGVHLSEVA